MDLLASIREIWTKPVERNTAHSNALVKSLQQNVVIDSVSR